LRFLFRSKKKTIANARRSYGTYENSTVKSTVSAAIKTQLCSLPPTNQSPLLSFSSTEESFRRFSQQVMFQSDYRYKILLFSFTNFTDLDFDF
jgi:hypothetical protein